ncbi:MAG: FliA/WhiG family RNA polymerase sigma factor [Candidatus Wallbacteria bacterium]|nr:FliA/WhiG family RNA polymerase sigma factor [Candidatus Wallbacteria bacterium]
MRKQRELADKIRDELIVRNVRLVKYVAGRMAIGLPASVSYDDLVSDGLFGLIDAVEKFNPELKIQFPTYAKTRIKGAILDALRTGDWAPRSVRQKARKLEEATVELEVQFGRPPTDEEICGRLCIRIGELHKLRQDLHKTILRSLDERDDEGDGAVSLSDMVEFRGGPGPEATVEQSEMRRIIAEEINKLPEQQRLVISLYHYEKLTMREIGKVLGVTDSRVSQVHTAAVRRLRVRLSALRGKAAQGF